MSSRRLIYAFGAVLLLVATAVAVVAAPASSGARAPTSSSQVGVSRFVLVVDGRDVAAFSELVGLASGFETSQLELSVGGSTPKLNLPGKRTPPTVTLKRGMTRDIELWDWHDDAIHDVSGARKSASLVMYDYEGRPLAKWTMVNAWPSKIEIESLAAGGGQNFPIEKVTIVSERLVREQ
jgi:phage tail-like protein